MRQVSASAEIPGPPQAVFAYLADPANLPEWQAGIVSAETTTPGPVGVGSTAHVVRELMGQRLAVDLTITTFEPGRRLVLGSAISGIAVEATLDLQPAGEATRLTFSMEIRAQNMFMTPMEGMVAGAAERDLATSVERLRARFSKDEAPDRAERPRPA